MATTTQTNGGYATAYGIPLHYLNEAERDGVDLADEDAARAHYRQAWDRDADEERISARPALLEAVHDRIPPRFEHATADHPAVLAWVAEVVEVTRAGARNPGVDWVRRGPSLLLCGPVGTGKTHQCWGAVRLFAEQAVNAGAVFTTTADMYGALRPRHGVDSETELRKYTHARLLILDDLGAAKLTEWTEEIDYRILGWRYDNDLPTVITTNCTPPQLPERLGQRVASRLTEMCTIVPLTGADRRIVRAA
jgi:DNA replication protein DnaC